MNAIPEPPSNRPAARHGRFAISLVLTAALLAGGASATASSEKEGRGFSYQHDVVPEAPWSIHVVKIDRSASELELHTTLAGGGAIGLNLLSEQVRETPASLGKPLAGLNGDFYRNDGSSYNGDPKGLQIMEGELVSAPCDWSCFWIDPSGQPRMTNVTSRLEVIWPDNSILPLGLNEERRRSAAVLYTPRIGATTKTDGGMELLLDPAATSTSLPLRPGEIYTFRVRRLHQGGDSPVPRGGLILSLGSDLMRRIPKVSEGDMVKISTATTPSLKGVHTGIGGGPALVQGGKPRSWGLLQVRHPRSAIGWNEKYFYLVEVDGRQAGLSAGMTYSELARYMAEKLGCTEALNLDGGGSATMWFLGQVINSPSEGRERPMANALILTQKPLPSAKP